MPLTSLESIAEKLQENRKIQLEDILRISGSSAIARNEYGITEVNEDNIATSLVFKVVTKPKIDPAEVKKVIDVEIKELKPDIPTAADALIPKSTYDEQVQANNSLTTQITQLNSQIVGLNDQINNLKIQVDNEKNNRLNIEQSNDALNNQAAALNKSIDDLSKQIQNSIQKSAEETILRASLQAQNAGFKVQIEALTKQIDSLNSIIEGLQAQIGGVQQPQIVQNTRPANAQPNVVVVNDVVNIVLPGTTGNTFKVGASYSGQNSSYARFITGDKFTITNNDSNNIALSFALEMPTLTNATDWLSFSKNTFDIGGGKTDTVTLIINNNKIPYNPAAAIQSGGPTAKGTTAVGNILVKVKRVSNGQLTESVRYFPIQLTIDYDPTVYR